MNCWLLAVCGVVLVLCCCLVLVLLVLVTLPVCGLCCCFLCFGGFAVFSYLVESVLCLFGFG